MKTKIFEADDFQVDPDSREVVAVISTDSIDRDGEVVLPSGLQRKNYGGNPIVLYGHDSSDKLPIGTTRWIKASGNKLIAKYYISDKTQLGRDVFGLMQDGVLRAHSIGFLEDDVTAPTPEELAARPDWAGCNRVIRSWQLLEFSVVPIPCNQDCLAIAVAKCHPETRALLGKAWETDEKMIWQWDKEVEAEKARKDGESVKEVETCCDTIEDDAPINDESGYAVGVAPQPRYCRSWKSIEDKLNTVMKDRLSVNEILARLTGKA